MAGLLPLLQAMGGPSGTGVRFGCGALPCTTGGEACDGTGAIFRPLGGGPTNINGDRIMGRIALPTIVVIILVVLALMYVF